MEKPKEINHNCTVASIAEELDIPLWKVMELGKYFNKRLKSKQMSVEEIESIIVSVPLSNAEPLFRAAARAIHKEQEKRLEVK